MAAVDKVLVIGGGSAGLATAVLLARSGVTVDLVERQPDVTTIGSGITLQGNALRVLRELGVWKAAQAEGYSFDEIGVRAPDPQATLLAVSTDALTGGPDLPATMGMHRPTLARILVDRAREVGAHLHFGVSATGLEQDDDGVDVALDDGTRRRYDLVVGADGLRSWTRGALGIELTTRRTGMDIWRAQVPRPAGLERTDLVFGGPCYIAGYCPTGADTAYAYLVEDPQDRGPLDPEQQREVFRSLAQPYHGFWDAIRDGLDAPTATINHTWFSSHLLEPPWNRGRVVLIGDAVHVSPPTFAQGAAMALEDAAVLAELLLAADTVDDAFWTRLTDRRFERCGSVVNASLQMCQWLLEHNRDANVPGLMASVSALVTNPA
jgi:2-polyprenyl-6-methoxyphenol hydroxylase-like FAD-dependent oxidoreductase